MERIAQRSNISGQVYPLFWEDVENLQISGQWSGDKETRLTNGATATEVAAKVVADTTIKVVAEVIREEVQAVAAVAVVAEDNSVILPSSLLTL